MELNAANHKIGGADHGLRMSGKTRERGRDLKKLPLDDGLIFSNEMAKYCRTDKFDWPHYAGLYQRICAELRHKDPRVLEIGIGVNDPQVPSGMPGTHSPGSSLVGWRKYLLASEVHGADIDSRVLNDTSEYQAHFVDQRDIVSVNQLASCIGGFLDLVVDDGLHTPEANGNILRVFLPRLTPRGFLVIEDILPEFEALWLEATEKLSDTWEPWLLFPKFPASHSPHSGIAVFWRN